MNFKERIDSKDGFKYQWKIYRILGADPVEESNTIYWIYFVVINLCLTIYYPLSILINLFFINDLKIMLENLSMNFTNVAHSFKLLNYIIHRKELRKINPLLESLDKNVVSMNDKHILKKYIKISQYICFIHIFLFVFTVNTSSLSAFLSDFKKIVYPAWFPIDWKASKRNWYLVFCYQYFGITIQAIQNAMNDTYPVSYLLILTAHTRLLKNRIERVGKDSQKSLDENYEDLIKCIKDYKLTLRYVPV